MSDWDGRAGRTDIVRQTPVDRMLDFLPPDIQDKVVLVVGCGAVGRRAALMLAGLGVSLVLCDPDDVEVRNVGPQGWRLSDVGFRKVDVLADECLAAGSSQVVRIPAAWADRQESEDWVAWREGHRPDGAVLAVDSMRARWDIMFDLLDGGCPVVETRMAALTGRVWVVRTPDELAAWCEDWYPDEECIQVPCTRRATAWTAAVVAGMAAGLMSACLAGRTIRQNPIEWSCQEWADWAGGAGRRLLAGERV